ncbi:MAG TPA: hypothetical protein VM032_03715 [Vicinamibacterales bacterium]|nr:hypothetical protein [Vicinamibacterales bacterium]
MFIGHFALGFAAKPVVPRVSLAMLIFAALFADVLWPVLVLAGFEHVNIVPGYTAFTPLEFVSYPWSHSLAMLVLWGAGVGGAYRGIFGGRRTFAVLALLVVSHWVLDWVTHAPDMPIYPGGPKLGLSLWNSVAGTMAVETLMFAGGLYLYARHTTPADAVGRWGLVALAAVIAIIYAADSLSGVAPPSVAAICVVALAASALFPAFAWWVDRHRRVTE